MTYKEIEGKKFKKRVWALHLLNGWEQGIQERGRGGRNQKGREGERHRQREGVRDSDRLGHE